METLKIEVGPIAFLDILGYKSFISRNEPEDAAKIIKEVIYKTLSTLIQDISKALPQNSENDIGVGYVLANWEALIVSDSIIAWIPLTEDLSILSKCSAWSAFIVCINRIQRDLFMGGLPVRGAISYGKLAADAENSLIVGKPLIEAYELTGAKKTCLRSPAGAMENNPPI